VSAGGPEAPLWRARRFLPLFAAQFLGVLNDQMFQKAFVALLTYRLGDATGLSLEALGAIASGLFILPFAIIAPTAGQIADRVDKARMMRWVKAWEVVVMAMAVIGFHLQDVTFLFVVLFLMGAQSALFAPVKYAILPQYLRRDELLAGNGLVQGGTFVAILLGAIVGTELVLREGGVAIVSALVIAVAVAGWLAALVAPPAPPTGRAEAVDWLIPRAVARLIADSRRRPEAWRAILAIAWFWFVGATFLSLLPAYARVGLGADETVVTALLAAFSIGVAGGSLAAARLARWVDLRRLPAAGAAGIAAAAVALWFATEAVPRIDGALIDRAAFLAAPEGLRVLAGFALLAACAGLYVTPLNMALQLAAPPERRGRFVAASNVVDAAAIVLSAAMVALSAAAGLDAADIMALFALTGAPLAVFVGSLRPRSS
jgi:MFS family permease